MSGKMPLESGGRGPAESVPNPDEVLTALLPRSRLRVVVATASALSRKAQALGALADASAALLSQGLLAASLMGALHKHKSRGRLHLQLECDGPLRGLFVDSSPDGSVRGYVKNRQVSVVGGEGEFRWRAALGNNGFLSVLRDKGEGEFYRSSIQLKHFDLARDLELYFEQSEQLPARLALEVVGGDGHAWVAAGVLLQPLPDGDREALGRHGRRLEKERPLAAAVRAWPDISVTSLLKELFTEECEITSRFPIEFRCSCSKERVKDALVALGHAELSELFAKEGKAEATCEFCTAHYLVTGEELSMMLSQMKVS
jgi:molecular chaperone Hsp33